MTSDVNLMTSDVLVLHYIQLVVKIFNGVVEKIASKLSVSEFVSLFVNFQFFELLYAAKNIVRIVLQSNNRVCKSK